MYHINIHWTRCIGSLIAINFLLLSHHTYYFQTQKPKVIADYSSSLVVHKRLFLWKFFALILCLLFLLFPLKYSWQCQESRAGLSVYKAGPQCFCLLGELYALAWKQSHQSRGVRTQSRSSVEDSSASRKSVWKVLGGMITKTELVAVRMERRWTLRSKREPRNT